MSTAQDSHPKYRPGITRVSPKYHPGIIQKVDIVNSPGLLVHRKGAALGDLSTHSML
jgi:hypothetical protein